MNTLIANWQNWIVGILFIAAAGMLLRRISGKMNQKKDSGCDKCAPDKKH